MNIPNFPQKPSAWLMAIGVILFFVFLYLGFRYDVF